MKPELVDVIVSSLETYLNPQVWTAAGITRVSEALAHGRLVVVHRALHEPFAERMFRCLDGFTDWELHESYGAIAAHDPDDPFHYQKHNISDPRLFPRDLALCHSVFGSAATRRFVARLAGRSCDAGTSMSASWYKAGDHSLPHNDRVALRGAVRQVGFVWHLTRGWRPEWGGALYWCPANRYLSPAFNTLILFRVDRESYHLVTQVSPYAEAKRLAINGWWLGKSGADEDGGHDEPPAASDIEVI